MPVLITKILTEVLPAVADGHSIQGIPVRARADVQNALSIASEPLRGLEGLALDVEYYAQRIKEAAWETLRHLYPGDGAGTPIAWHWSRTARCPNPACGAETILATSWWLSRKPGELAWIQPRVQSGTIELDVVSDRSSGGPPPAPKSGRGAAFECLACGDVISGDEVKRQGIAGQLGLRMTAVTVDMGSRRSYRSPTLAEIEAAQIADLDRAGLDVPIVNDPRSMWCVQYGVDSWDKLYTSRQLLVLATFADLVAKTHGEVIDDGGTKEWADAITAFLALAVGKLSQYGSSQAMITTPSTGPTRFNSAFGRNDLPMTWDFYEQNFFGSVGGTWEQNVKTALLSLKYVSAGIGRVVRADARVSRPTEGTGIALVATDPPYFDAIGYADLSDYFYIWHRRALRNVFPEIYATVAAPKQNELTAIPVHHGNDKSQAQRYFIEGFTETFGNLQTAMRPDLPMLIVYASKEQKGGKEEETRWSSILTAMLNANLEITGTWPIHGTGSTRMIGMGTNSVATYVVMVARPRPSAAGTCSLQDFNRALRRELRPAVEDLQAAGILPVDLAQAAMGPGMQVYSRYRSVLDQSGGRVPVEQALRLINQALTEVLNEQEGELDPDSRFAVTLWEKNHWGEATFGEADQVARPQGISVDDVVRAKVVAFPRAGFVKLLGRGELDRDWSPNEDARPTAWEAVHHLADRLIDGGGVSDAGRLMTQLGPLRDQAQALVYRLHEIAARKGWTEDQERYNALIGSWSDLLAEGGRIHNNGDGLF